MDLGEGLRLVAIAYLLALAAAASVGAHRPLLAYPIHLLYALTSLALRLGSLGRVRLAPLPAAGPRRSVAQAWREWREIRAEERAIARGEEIKRPQQEWLQRTQPEQIEVPQQLGAAEATPLLEEPEPTELPTLPDYHEG